jgi:Protein of unknown function (DUF3306)
MKASFVAFPLLSLLLVLSLGKSAVAEERQVLASSLAVATMQPAEAIDIDSLTWESDYTAFMSEDCPPDIRKRALRRLWSAMPSTGEVRADPF